MLAKIRACLEPGRPGRPGRVPPGRRHRQADPVEHRMSVEQVLKEWSPAGFELVETDRDAAFAASLPLHHPPRRAGIPLICPQIPYVKVAALSGRRCVRRFPRGVSLSRWRPLP